MKWFMHVEPAKDKEPVYSFYSEKAVLEAYWDHWQTNMMIKNVVKKLPQMENVTHENCIQDWMTIHWAQEVPEQAVLEFMTKSRLSNTAATPYENHGQ